MAVVTAAAETEEHVQRIPLAFQRDAEVSAHRYPRAGVGDAGDRARAVQGPRRRLRGPPLLVKTIIVSSFLARSSAAAAPYMQDPPPPQLPFHLLRELCLQLFHAL